MPGLAVERGTSRRGGSAPRAGRAPRSPGFTLLELLIVVAVMGILAGIALPYFHTSLPEQLQSAAQVTAADLAYAQSLAIGGGSTYRISFEPGENRYRLTHAGSNPALDALPPHPLRSPREAPERQTTDFDLLPHAGSPVRLVGAYTRGGSWQQVGTIEFGPLGATTRSQPTHIWLAAGEGRGRRFISVEVHPTTGIASIGPITSLGP